jgi:polyisoprenoid-binding protein YceI
MRNKFKLVLAASAAFALVAAVALSAGALVQAQAPFTQAPAEVRSGRYVLDPAHSKVTWSVSHMGFSTYVGQFSGVDGTLQLDSRNPARSTLQATVKTDSVGTFSDGLDKHLKTADFLDTAKHPTATFRSKSLQLVDADTARITGNLTLRGVTRPVVIEADFTQAGVNPLDKTYSLGFDGEAVIKRSEFGVSYGLPAVGDAVTLRLAGEFKLASPAAS